MRKLSATEEVRLMALTRNSVSLTLIEPTQTGLKKSIMDATWSVRNYLDQNDFHDYRTQKQGQENKIVVNGFVYDQFSEHKSKVSLYRPNTKNGDPRIWVSGLQKFSAPNDIIALIGFQNEIHVFNLSQIPVDRMINSSIENPLKELVREISKSTSATANELLIKLRQISKYGPLPSLVDADTSVGRTLENALNIKINSSKKPDYKGIEIKSFRSKRNNRKNLFTQVPDWGLSKLKSSAEILNEFGYWRENTFKLYCTVSAQHRNTQGLMLRMEPEIQQLIENSDKPEVGDFAVWELGKLHARLLEKHKETFWIEADSIIIDGKEHFIYTLAEHTRKPIISQFDLLIGQGAVSLDHLIKKNPKGAVTEKGPIFKMKPSALALLFPPSQMYQLLEN